MKKILSFIGAVIAAVFIFAEEIQNLVGIVASDEFGGQVSSLYQQESIPDALEIPSLVKDAPEQILQYEGFTVSFNNRYRLPNWVAYNLTAEEVNGQGERKDSYNQDPRVAGAQASSADYKRSGWDKGHMAPAADMKWSGNAMKESCYFTNICPQNHELNTGDWRILEEQCRKWAEKYGSLYIVCGPIVEKNTHGKLGENGVVIPDKFYKVVLARIKGEYRGVGFIYVNPPKRKTTISTVPPVRRPLESYAVTINEVEKVTGIDFFPNLPDKIESAVQQQQSLF